MSPNVRKRSLAGMQQTDNSLPCEYNEREYADSVLRLEGEQTEAQFDEQLAKEAESLGIIISRPCTPNQSQHATHESLCGSANTVPSHHRTASSGSHGSASTGMTSRSSNEQLDSSNHSPQQLRKRMSARRSLSFSEYEKYLAQHGSTKPILLPPLPSEPAPSLFSVSTRKSYMSIKNGIKSKFKFRRAKSSQDDLK